MSILNELKARQALANAGIDVGDDLVRAPSVTNEVWMSPDHVIRLGLDKSGRLAREAALADRLPPEVGCPEVIEVGQQGHLTYLVSRRLPGVPLSHVWAHLTPAERRSTMTSLGRRLAVLHQVSAEGCAPVPDPPQPLGGPQHLSPLHDAIAQASLVDGVDLLLMAETSDLVQRLSPYLRVFPTDTLIHGDLTFANVLWHEGEVTGLLDFEFSRGAPNDLDLDILLRMCGFPELFADDAHVADARRSDYDEVRADLQRAYPELFSVHRLNDRLRLYAVAFTVRELTQLDSIVPGIKQLPAHPQQRLHALVHATSYID